MSFELNGKRPSHQRAKEVAIYLGITEGFALCRDGLKVYAIYPNGDKKLFCTSPSTETIWHCAVDTFAKKLD